MTQRPNSSSVHMKNPSLIRVPLPFTGDRVGAPPPLPLPPFSQPMEDRNGAGYSPSLPPSPFPMYHSGENLTHRRSNSDVTFAMMSPQSLSLERPISGSDWSMPRNSTEGESSDNVNGLKRQAGGGDIAPSNRHYRSVSMDSCFLGKLNFGDDKLPPLSSSAQVSPTNSGEGNSNAAYSIEFGNTKFSAAEMNKISADKKLSAIVTVDPKQVKRMLANRKSAARSKEKQVQYTADLEHQVQTLKNETTRLSAQLRHSQKNVTELTNENSELKFRLQAMEQHAQLRDALHERLYGDVQRLKLVIGEQSHTEPMASLNPEMFQQSHIEPMASLIPEMFQQSHIESMASLNPEMFQQSHIESMASLNPEMFQQQLRISPLQQQQQQQQHSNQNCTMEAYPASNQQF